MALNKLPSNASLKEAVAQSENINTEISTLKGKLKTNLVNKGVTATDSDKMSNLIDKVSNIIAVSFTFGNSFTAYIKENIGGDKFPTTEVEIGIFEVVYNGSYTATGTLSGNVNTTPYIYIRHIRGSNIILEKSASKVGTKLTLDIPNVEKGDNIAFFASGGKYGSSYAKVDYISVSSELEFSGGN